MLTGQPLENIQGLIIVDKCQTFYAFESTFMHEIPRHSIWIFMHNKICKQMKLNKWFGKEKSDGERKKLNHGELKISLQYNLQSYVGKIQVYCNKCAVKVWMVERGG